MNVSCTHIKSSCDWSLAVGHTASHQVHSSTFPTSALRWYLFHRPIGIMVWVFANDLGERGSISGRVTPKTQKWYLLLPSFLPSLIPSIIRCGSRVKWSNPEKRVGPSSIPGGSRYWKEHVRVALKYSRQLYVLIIIIIIICHLTIKDLPRPVLIIDIWLDHSILYFLFLIIKPFLPFLLQGSDVSLFSTILISSIIPHCFIYYISCKAIPFQRATFRISTVASNILFAYLKF